MSNRDGIGARLHLVTDSGQHQYAMVGCAGSYLSSSDKRVHFGLGPKGGVALLEIIWPSGITQRLENLPREQNHQRFVNQKKIVDNRNFITRWLVLPNRY